MQIPRGWRNKLRRCLTFPPVTVSGYDARQIKIIPMLAKLGTNVESVLQEVVRRLPPPKIEKGSRLKALLFDSTFDHYRGVVASIAMCGGDVCKGNKIVSAHSGHSMHLTKGLYLHQDP
ncbi:translation factor Guf1, mitochondrial-like isoform X1 [Phyllobates terribilis]|uniref:translation factor Guf1, mitochondrial-like isoform X1 n=1 Tax=Phyllobates terribilis TaxID=111132 RepID=UPI003CCAAFEF